MPDKRKHRGPHPADTQLFAADQLARLRLAAADLSWLYSRGYAEKASLKLVGDRFRLKSRQRLALMRSTCSRQAREARLEKERLPAEAAGEIFWIDGFNLIITVESALSGGYIFAGKDGCYRDLAGIHGSYKRVTETEHAIRICGEELSRLQPQRVCWLLDKPVSNSGRLLTMLRECAEKNGWPWQIDLHYNPDTVLIKQEGIVISTDGIVLNGAGRWLNFARLLIDGRLPQTNIVNLFL